jgi:DHA1 family bicyclomycin/chloramphenicol resistance-like MFS transporter
MAGKLTVWVQVNAGFCFLIGAAFTNVVYHALFAPQLFWSVMPLFFYAFGMSLVAPGATLLVLDLFPEIRGVVASCQSASVTFVSALIAGLVAPALDHAVFSLALGQLTCCVIAASLWYSGRRFSRSHM